MILRVSIRVEAREMKSARKLRFARTEYVAFGSMRPKSLHQETFVKENSTGLLSI